MRDERGLVEAFLGDGRLPLSLTGFILVLSGWFAIFQSMTGYFLPQMSMRSDSMLTTWPKQPTFVWSISCFTTA
jgi:hypothetical protein